MPGSDLSALDRRSYIKATGAGVALGTLAGCLGDSDDTVLISSLQPLSGVFAQYGPRHQRGADYAASVLNDDGGVLDQDVELNHVDTGSSGDEAASSFLDHIEEGAVAAIGPGSSEAAVQGGQVANDEEVPLLLHAAGGSSITDLENEYIFRTNLAATPQSARAIGQLIEERGYSEGATIYEDGLWGDEFRAGVEEYFPDDVTIHSDSAPIPESDFTPILREFPEDIEFFLGTAHPAGNAQMYPQALDLGLEFELWTAAITPMEADWQELGELAAEREYCSFNHVDLYSDSYAEIAQEYYDETDDIFDHAQAGGYLAVMLVADAIEEADSTDPADIGEALRNGSFDLGIYANPIEYTEYGEIDNVVQIYNGFEVGDPPEHWPDDVGFSPREVFRSEAMPAYDHSLDI